MTYIRSTVPCDSEAKSENKKKSNIAQSKGSEPPVKLLSNGEPGSRSGPDERGDVLTAMTKVNGCGPFYEKGSQEMPKKEPKERSDNDPE